ncbi:MAG: uroporphyrinogen decarboxylase family protein [Candidatus Riflebacteria bacterium]|nr:uroporphyrinogen decarboxylase family protein [Candidatus Riflebacteria bacterium]
MTSLNRVLTALSQKEPDRTPLFLLFSCYGAKEKNISIKEYFSNPDNVIEAQIKLQKKFSTDCYYGFFYASLEIEAFGGRTFFFEDGSPNAEGILIEDFDQINQLKPPCIEECLCLKKPLAAISGLKKETGDSIPIIGVVMSPFSLPVMQLGFEKYLNLILFHRELFDKLMEVNQQFCVSWANAQLAAGATAICYFDPISSPSITPPKLYRETGFRVAKQTIAQIKGPTATHMASGKCKTIINDLAETGTAIIGVSSLEDIGEIKKLCNGRLSVLGNINGLEMCRWSEEQAEAEVKNIIKKASSNGGLLLADNHGEIPWHVSEKTLLAISRAVMGKC